MAEARYHDVISMTRQQEAGTAGRRYKCIFFDLDHTLWDYELNARETLSELHEAYGLESKGIPLEDFCEEFRQVNLHLWDQYDSGRIASDVIRTERFKRIFARFNVHDGNLSDAISIEYLQGCPRKPNLVPRALETLEYLSQRYRMTVITNGFDEVQSVKLLSGNITQYFDYVITSQKCGHRKPAREIFEYALSVNKLACHEAIMIGDNLVTDIGGAKNACVDTVFFNPASISHDVAVDHEIRCLSELKNIL